MDMPTVASRCFQAAGAVVEQVAEEARDVVAAAWAEEAKAAEDADARLELRHIESAA